MRVKELIEALSKCDPNAHVLTDIRVNFDDDAAWTEGHLIERVESGFSDCEALMPGTVTMESDLSFSTDTPSPDSHICTPSVRLVGNHFAKREPVVEFINDTTFRVHHEPGARVSITTGMIDEVIKQRDAKR